MTVAFDAFTSGSGAMPSFSWNHVPVGTPRAIIVWLVGTVGSDNITSVTYGGTSMTEVAGSPNVLSTGETGQVHCFFLGASIPTGTQSVAVSGTGTTTIGGRAVSLTAVSNTEVVDSDGTINSTSQADPSVTLSLGGRNSWCGLGLWSGHDGVGSITPLTNWTDRLEVDHGTEVSALYTYDIIGSTDVTAGWTQTAEDALMIAVAISEVQGTAYSLTLDPGSFTITGAAATLVHTTGTRARRALLKVGH